MRAFTIIVLLTFSSFLLAQSVENKNFWKDVELEFSFKPSVSFGVDVDYLTDVMPYLNEQNDQLNLLDNVYHTSNPIGVEAYSNDYGDCCWDMPLPDSYFFSFGIHKALSTQYVKNLFYLGANVQYGVKAIGEDLRNDDFGLFSDRPYQNTVYFLEPDKRDSVRLSYYNEMDTMIVNRAKLVTFQNPRNIIQLGLSLRTVVFKSKKENFRISFDLGASFTRATSNSISIYSQYYDYERLPDYEYVYSTASSRLINEDFLDAAQLLNGNTVDEITSRIQAPALHGSSYALGVGFDYKLIRSMPLTFGFRAESVAQAYSRASQFVGTNRIFSVVYSLSYIL
ncbi:MAG: hypothetical protein RLZZ337_1898 [Bacteroidota bacterium]|jgi:hypothetical protein